MLQVTHLVNTLRPELHLWEHAWLYKKIREGLGHSLTFLLRQPYTQKHTPGRSTDLFRVKYPAADAMRDDQIHSSLYSPLLCQHRAKYLSQQ